MAQLGRAKQTDVLDNARPPADEERTIRQARHRKSAQPRGPLVNAVRRAAILDMTETLHMQVTPALALLACEHWRFKLTFTRCEGLSLFQRLVRAHRSV